MLKRIAGRIAAAALAALMGSAALPALAGTITVTDTEGRTVHLQASPQRIVLGFYFEDFLAVAGPDAFSRVVGISKKTWHGWRNSQWKAYVAAIPRIAQLADVGEAESGTFSTEKVLSLNPDAVILAAWQYRALKGSIGSIEAAGVPVIVLDYNAQTVEKHVESTNILGRVMGTEDRAEKLAGEYATAVADIAGRIAKLGKPRPKVYVEIGSKGPDEVGNSYGDTMWGPLVGRAGGANIAKGKISGWGPLSPEYVLVSDPDFVAIAGSYWVGREKAVLMGFGVDGALTRSRLEPYARRPGWSGLKAVKNRQLHALYHGGVRTLYDYAFIQYIAKALYPEAFQDVDPAATHRRFYEKYLPIKAEGVFMTAID